MARIRRVDDKRDMEKTIDDFKTQGFNIKSEGERTTMLKKHTWGSGSGHIAVAALTAWWTLGIGNAIYAIYKNRTAEEIQIKIEE